MLRNKLSFRPVCGMMCGHEARYWCVVGLRVLINFDTGVTCGTSYPISGSIYTVPELSGLQRGALNASQPLALYL